MAGMSKDKKAVQGTKAKPNRKGVPQSFYLNGELADALDAFMAHQRIPPTKTAVYEEALKLLLSQEGFWPPPAPKKLAH
jgi:hypothetical protein